MTSWQLKCPQHSPMEAADSISSSPSVVFRVTAPSLLRWDAYSAHKYKN